MSINHASAIREDLRHIKSGEEDKKKIYRALCTIGSDVTLDVLEKLCIDDAFEIQQWTPLRVLHRRTLMNRPRTIFGVKAFAVKGELSHADDDDACLKEFSINRQTKTHRLGHRLTSRHVHQGACAWRVWPDRTEHFINHRRGD